MGFFRELFGLKSSTSLKERDLQFVREEKREVASRITQVVADRSKFKIWRRVRIGTGVISSAKLKENGVNVDASILDRVDFSLIEQELDLVLVTGYDLGLSRNCRISIEEFISLAEAHELQRCPSEVGPQLRLQYLSQNDQYDHMVAMTPITVPQDRSCRAIFVVGYYGSSGKLFLNQHWIESRDRFHPSTRMIFVLPRV